jgi:catechol 2,3-dioxygenase-like lactoylglutathione lyase family enzyme
MSGGQAKGMNTRVERINPCLNVEDVRASVEYYVDILGFELYVQLPTLGIVERNGHQIHLRLGERGPVPSRVWIGVGDVGVLYKQYTAKNARIRQEPTNYSWAYQMEVEDPDGHILVLGSEPREDLPFTD